MLIARGDKVWTLKRSAAATPEGITALYGNIADPATCAQIPDSVETIYYTAAPGSGDEASYREIYVDGLRCLLGHLGNVSHRVRRLVVTSSTGVYHQNDGSWVDENSPTHPTRETARRILDGESLLSESNLETISLRLSGIYGPGRTRLIRSVASGDATYVDGQPHYTNRIHQEDCAGALIHLMGIPSPAPVYIGVDYDTAERYEMLSWIADQIGVARPKPISTEAASPRLRHANKRCRNTLLSGSGYTFKYRSYTDGYSPMLKTWLESEQGL